MNLAIGEALQKAGFKGTRSFEHIESDLKREQLKKQDKKKKEFKKPTQERKPS
jgi:hypothetical protein